MELRLRSLAGEAWVPDATLREQSWPKSPDFKHLGKLEPVLSIFNADAELKYQSLWNIPAL